MALIYDAELSPTKPEIIQKVIADKDWFKGSPAEVTPKAAYRFDDPKGVSGFEIHIVADAAGNLYQIPLSYRPAPFDAAEAGFITQMEHSVLGTRYIYDATFDPEFHDLLASALNGDVGQAEELLFLTKGTFQHLQHTFEVSVPEKPEVPVTPAAAIEGLRRTLVADTDTDSGLVGHFPGQQSSYRLA